MPRYDGTGPMGMGPMTGKGKGYCIVPLDDSYSFDRANGVDNNRHTTNVYSNGDFRMRRLFGMGNIRRRRANAHK
jgi:hypothetical protein